MDNIRPGKFISILLTIVTLIVSAIGVCSIVLIYSLFTTVDLSFVNDGVEIYRIENVNYHSEIEVPEDKVDPAIDFTYAKGDEKVEFKNDNEFKRHIAETVFDNFISFKWNEADHVIVLESK